MCFEQYQPAGCRTPMVLACGHSVCRTCLPLLQRGEAGIARCWCRQDSRVEQCKVNFTLCAVIETLANVAIGRDSTGATAGRDADMQDDVEASMGAAGVAVAAPTAAADTVMEAAPHATLARDLPAPAAPGAATDATTTTTTTTTATTTTTHTHGDSTGTTVDHQSGSGLTTVAAHTADGSSRLRESHAPTSTGNAGMYQRYGGALPHSTATTRINSCFADMAAQAVALMAELQALKSQTSEMVAAQGLRR